MNILLLYPEYPETFWNFKHALKFISKKATEPPLGLQTISAMLPGNWDKKLVDMNITKLKDNDVIWADYVFLSAMSIQKKSVYSILEKCKQLNTKVVAGGPLFTAESEEFPNVDYLVLNEAEITLPLFLKDLENGCAKHVYSTEDFADITTTPVPDWSLVDMKKYASMDIQFSRGCPYNCDFCEIVQLYGRKVRTKSSEQVINELEALYSTGWRSGVFFVDDNFIGNKKVLKRKILPAIIKWMAEKKNPFSFSTEASINLADDSELMNLMAEAGFDSVFIGIESPNAESLAESNKVQNKNRNMVESVHKIQEKGIMVKGGFIIGFDNDPPKIFNKIIDFIQESVIINAMIGLLNAPKGTSLYKRLNAEGRILSNIGGNNTDLITNIKTKMDYESLVEGYKNVVKNIYSPKVYYNRVMKYLRQYKPVSKKSLKFHVGLFKPLLKTTFFLGIVGKERWYYWKLFFWTIFTKPKLFPLAMTLSVFGHHFRRVYEVL